MNSKRLSGWIGGIVAVALPLAVLSGCAHEQEDKNEPKVTLDQVPAAVQATLNREAGSGKIGEIEKETKEGKVAYEADATIDGKPYEIKVAEDGTLLKKKLEDKDEEHEGGESHN